MPVWILHRSEKMLDKIDSSIDELRDPNSELSVQPNFAKNTFRSIKPEYLVVEGVCTHLGCAPIEKFAIAPADMGPDWKGGFFCPCHGSKFDLSGRVFAGVPAPSNLRIPPHRYENETTLIIGENEEEENA
jgi:ubiquinol-cytochrome c reductase iron-sulfur subunit